MWTYEAAKPCITALQNSRFEPNLRSSLSNQQATFFFSSRNLFHSITLSIIFGKCIGIEKSRPKLSNAFAYKCFYSFICTIIGNKLINQMYKMILVTSVENSLFIISNKTQWVSDYNRLHNLFLVLSERCVLCENVV